MFYPFLKKNYLLKALVALILFCFSSLPVYGKDYMVEVLVFENLTPSRAYEPTVYNPPEPLKSDSETWLIEPSMLLEEAEAIKNSADYVLHHHYSWGQESLPYSQSAVYQVIEERMNGWFKIYATQLLYANVDIDFNGYRMIEKRRLKLNERHFFDHPKFGILMQVSRLEPKEELVEETESLESELLNNR